MIVRCARLEDFIENLRHSDVADDIVYLDWAEEPLNGTKQDAVSFAVKLKASFIQCGKDADCLVIYEQECGIDRRIGVVSGIGEFNNGCRSSVTIEGTDRRKQIYNELVEFCQSRGLNVRPGVLEPI